MKKEPHKPRQAPPDPKDRQARLAAALKANIAKRKAQAAAKETDKGQEKP